MKILFVCLGNICRSPIAEGILTDMAKAKNLNWEINSAGTNGLHCGEQPHHLSCKVSKKNGVDIQQQVSTKLTKTDFLKYDVLYAMAEDVMADMHRIGKDAFDNKKCLYFLSENKEASHNNVPDPWYGEEDGYDEVFTIIQETCKNIIDKYSTSK